MRKWSEYEWPGWVPQRVRDQLEEFWREDWNRGPDAWLEDADLRREEEPQFGERVYMERHGTIYVGRWLHCWNNMGRLITDDGDDVVVSSFDRVEPASCDRCGKADVSTTKESDLDNKRLCAPCGTEWRRRQRVLREEFQSEFILPTPSS